MRGFSLVCLLFALCNVGLAQDESPTAPGGKIVVRVRFEGNRRYTDEFLKEQIATKEGLAYDPGLIARDERILRKYFAAVLNTFENEIEGGIEVVFVVLDNVVVGKVFYPGLARVKKKDFEALVATRPGQPLLEHSIESDRQLLERLHHEKGYRFVDVVVKRRPTRKPDVDDVVFEIQVGPA